MKRHAHGSGLGKKAGQRRTSTGSCRVTGGMRRTVRIRSARYRLPARTSRRRSPKRTWFVVGSANRSSKVTARPSNTGRSSDHPTQATSRSPAARICGSTRMVWSRSTATTGRSATAQRSLRWTGVSGSDERSSSRGPARRDPGSDLSARSRSFTRTIQGLKSNGPHGQLRPRRRRLFIRHRSCSRVSGTPNGGFASRPYLDS